VSIARWNPNCLLRPDNGANGFCQDYFRLARDSPEIRGVRGRNL
jgi:hypothetical protein